MKEITEGDYQYLCEKYHLTKLQLDLILNERGKILAKMQPSLSAELILGVQTLITIKKAQGHDIVISESKENQQILKSDNGGYILNLMCSSVAQYLFNQYDIIVKGWASNMFTSDADLKVMREINKVNLEWMAIKKGSRFDADDYAGWHFQRITNDMLLFMNKAFMRYSLYGKSREQQLWGKTNQIIGFYAETYAQKFVDLTSKAGVVPKAFAFDLLYLAEVIPHTDKHEGKNESYVDGTNQIYAGNNSGKAQYIKAKIKCYNDAKL